MPRPRSRSTTVASHLGIRIDEYDRRIRTFVPWYEEMLDACAGLVGRGARTIVDLGVGTGALAARCLKVAPRATVIGIDADRDVLDLAARRLGKHATLICAGFEEQPLPRADAIVASLALHHLRTPRAKRRMFRRIAKALRPGGLFVSADCCPASDRALAAADRRGWQAHLRTTYSAAQATAYLRAWSHEDVYMPLAVELALMRAAGLRPDVVWRKGAFAVVAGKA